MLKIFNAAVMRFFQELKQRNRLLYWFGWFNMAVGLACLAGVFLDDKQILGVSRWLKPMKFYFSVGLMVWTMGWLMYYLDNKKKIARYSWLIFITMFFENGLIILQAFRFTTSHFNIKTPVDIMIFNLMGIFILIFTITIVLVCISFFRQKTFSISTSYFWGIRLGLLFFILFSLEGGMMLGMMQHTVGGPDGSPGLPMVNWSRQFGDLRIAHFFGIHSLQVLPLAGYLLKTRVQTFLVTTVYILIVVLFFVQAFNSKPLFS